MQDFVADPALDPVAQARAFRDWEIGLVGDRDPAEVQAELPARAQELLTLAGSDAVTRPSDQQWSVLELLAHLADTEIICAARYRYTIAHDRPALVGFDPELLMDRLHPSVGEEEPSHLVELLQVLRRANLELWRRTSGEDRARVAIHPERGPEDLETMFRQMAGHGILHLDQMRRAIEEIRSS
jgi:hypothetical protein